MFIVCSFYVTSRIRHTICALVTGVKTCALPIFLVVDVPVTVQHARLLQRDGIDAALAARMIAAQATRRQRLAIADDVIVNDGALAALYDHDQALDRRYRPPASDGATSPPAPGYALDFRIASARTRRQCFRPGRGRGG